MLFESATERDITLKKFGALEGLNQTLGKLQEHLAKLAGDKFMNIALWIIQVLLALLFLFAGAMKFIMPVEEMTKQMPVAVSGLFLHFIGVCEVLGGLGLILPMLLRIKPWLTPLAAIGLAIIIIGAIVFSLKLGVMAALMPLVVELLLIFVAYGRWRLAPAR